MDAGGFDWTLIKIVGVLVLVTVIAWALLRNRKERPPAGKTEDATRRLYEEEDRAHRGESDNVP